MSIVYFSCNSGANIHSCRTEKMDTVADLGLGDGEWEEMTEDEKYQMVEEWANDRLEIFWSDEKPRY